MPYYVHSDNDDQGEPFEIFEGPYNLPDALNQLAFRRDQKRVATLFDAAEIPVGDLIFKHLATVQKEAAKQVEERITAFMASEWETE